MIGSLRGVGIGLPIMQTIASTSAPAYPPGPDKGPSSDDGITIPDPPVAPIRTPAQQPGGASGNDQGNSPIDTVIRRALQNLSCWQQESARRVFKHE